MKRQISRKPEILRDLIEQADYIAQHSPASAARFLDAAESTFSFLADNPEVGQNCLFRHPEAQGIRVWRVKGFPKHLIFYRPDSHGVDIVRVFHGARDIEALFEGE